MKEREWKSTDSSFHTTVILIYTVMVTTARLWLFQQYVGHKLTIQVPQETHKNRIEHH